MRHPDAMGSAEVAAFLSDLAVHGQVSAPTQNDHGVDPTAILDTRGRQRYALRPKLTMGVGVVRRPQ